MKKLSPLLALLLVGVALAAEPVSVTLFEPADMKAAAEAQAACDSACSMAKLWRDRLAKAEAEEARAKAARAQTLSALAAKLGVTGKSFSVRTVTTVDDGVEVKTVVLVATQE